MSVTPHTEPEVTGGAASAVALTIDGRKRDLGDGFIVRRLLPSVARRLVGPFSFVDHLGPVALDPGRGARLALPDEHAGRAAYVVAGGIIVDGEPHPEGSMVVFRENAQAEVQATAEARVMLLGGARYGFASADE